MQWWGKKPRLVFLWYSWDYFFYYFHGFGSFQHIAKSSDAQLTQSCGKNRNEYNVETFKPLCRKKVNGRDVSSKEDAETLFSENKNAVTLLVSRSFYTVSCYTNFCLMFTSLFVVPGGERKRKYQGQMEAWKWRSTIVFRSAVVVFAINDESKMHNRTHNL